MLQALVAQVVRQQNACSRRTGERSLPLSKNTIIIGRASNVYAAGIIRRGVRKRWLSSNQKPQNLKSSNFHIVIKARFNQVMGLKEIWSRFRNCNCRLAIVALSVNRRALIIVSVCVCGVEWRLCWRMRGVGKLP